MIISNLSVPLLGLVDTAVLGHLDQPVYLAAVAVGGVILSFLYWGFGFLRMGTTGLAAQHFGRQDNDQNRQLAAQSILLAVTISLVILVTSPWLIALGLGLVGSPESSAAAAQSYIQIRLFSAPAVLINYSIIGWLIGQQDSRWPLLITLTTNVLNIVLDLLFVVVLKLNSDGAAMATVIAEYSGCGLALWVLRQRLAPLPGRLNYKRLTALADYQALLAVNRHLFVRTLTLLASLAFFTAQGASQGTVVLAANSLIMQLLMLTSYGLDGFAHAAEALTGKAKGEGKHSLFVDTCKQCGKWSLISALMFSLVYALAGSSMITMLSSIDSVVSEANRYLAWLIMLPLVSMAGYFLDGVFIGASQSKTMQNTMLLSALGVYLPVWYWSQHLGNHGLWLAFFCFNLARGLSLAFVFAHNTRQHRWV